MPATLAAPYAGLAAHTRPQEPPIRYFTGSLQRSESVNGPTLRQVIDTHRVRLMKIDAVHGVAAGMSSGDPSQACVIVYVDTDQWPAQLPHSLDGFPVELHPARGFQAT